MWHLAQTYNWLSALYLWNHCVDESEFCLIWRLRSLKRGQFEDKIMGGAYLVTCAVLCSVRFHTRRSFQLSKASRYFQTFAFCSWSMPLKAPPHCPNWDWRECACANFHSEALKRREGRLTRPWQYSRVTTPCYLRRFFSLQSNRQTLTGWRMQTPVRSIERTIWNGHVETDARRLFWHTIRFGWSPEPQGRNDT